MSKQLRNAIVILLLVSVCYVLYVKLSDPKFFEKFSDSPKVTIILFFASWCGHCEAYLSSNVFMNTYDKLQNKSDIKFVNYDYDKHKDLGNKYGVNSFPTIVAIDGNGNKISDFAGDRNSSSDLTNFANQALQSN